jgi:hypothetical protein
MNISMTVKMDMDKDMATDEISVRILVQVITFFLKINQAKSSISKVAKVSKANFKKKNFTNNENFWPRRAKIRRIFFRQIRYKNFRENFAQFHDHPIPGPRSDTSSSSQQCFHVQCRKAGNWVALLESPFVVVRQTKH